jgi:arginine/lysine/ornithine decarboxylase
VVIPGERISAEAIAQIQQAIAAGGHCTGPADYELQTLRVVAESDPIGAS